MTKPKAAPVGERVLHSQPTTEAERDGLIGYFEALLARTRSVDRQRRYRNQLARLNALVLPGRTEVTRAVLPQLECGLDTRPA